MTGRPALEAQAEQVRRDLDELAEQVAAGEIDEDTATGLASTYRRELAELETAIAGRDGDTGEGEPEEGEPGARSPRRLLMGAALLVGALAVTVGVVGSFAQQRDDGPLEGVAAGQMDLDSVSNETMEAVIASYRDDPDPVVAEQLPRMELALAERYFAEQAYDRAFEHYGQIIENPRSSPDVAARSLARVGWIVWVLNGETQLALSTIDRSLELVPSDPETLYAKGQIVWCGAGEPASAADLFEQVLATDRLPDEVVAQVEDDLELARAGEPCR